jgi:hypothetical protein
MFELRGSCHCENVRLEIALSRAPETYQPRACDCDFCSKHAAAYVSDAQGTLRIRVEDPQRLSRYRQGSDTAECLLCATCGVLLGVVYQEGGRTFATVNRRAIEGPVRLGEATPVSPKALGVDDKVSRWKSLWFSQVTWVPEAAGQNSAAKTK